MFHGQIPITKPQTLIPMVYLFSNYTISNYYYYYPMTLSYHIIPNHRISSTVSLPFPQVMQRWVSFLLPTLKPVQWGARDTKILLDAVSLLRTGEHIPWTQVCGWDSEEWEEVE